MNIPNQYTIFDLVVIILFAKTKPWKSSSVFRPFWLVFTYLTLMGDLRLHKMMWNLGALNERQLSNDSLTTGWNSLDWCSWWWLWSNQNCIWISCRKLQLSKLYQCFHMCVSWHYMLCMTKLYGSHILIASSSNQEIRQCHYQCQCLIQYIWIVKYIYVQNPLHLMCGNFVANENRIA